MIADDVVGDLEGRDLIWLTVLGTVMAGPVTLGVVVSQLEGLVLGELDGSPRIIARSLHEMERGGHIVLATDGKRWRVSLGKHGRVTFRRLMEGSPASAVATGLEDLARRVRARLSDFAAA